MIKLLSLTHFRLLPKAAAYPFGNRYGDGDGIGHGRGYGIGYGNGNGGGYGYGFGNGDGDYGETP